LLRRPRPDRWILLIAGVFALRIVLAVVLAETQLVPHNGWYWANKDQVEYYATAHALLHGGIARIYTFMGYGTLLAPLVVGTNFVLEALPPVVLVQFALAVPAAYWLYRAGVRLLDRRSAALGTALWLSTPLWLTAIWLPSYSKPFTLSTYWLGMQVSVDYASTLLAIGAMLLTAGARTDDSPGRGLLAGAVAGAALLCKPSNAVVVLAAVVALVAWRRWRSALFALLASGIVCSAQLVLNGRLNGDPAKFQYSSAWPYGGSKPMVSVTYIPRSFGKLLLLNYTGPLLVVAALVALVVTWRRFPEARWLVVAQPAAFALFFSVFYYSISEFMVRFMTPALPAICLAAGAALVGKRTPSTAAAAAPVRRRGLLAGAAVLAAAAALAVFVGLAPVRPLLPVLDSMRVHAAAVTPPHTLDLSWERPPAYATLGYQVERAQERDFTDARIVAAGVGTTAVDHPGAGTWWYQVLVTPGPSPGGWPPGRAFAVSRDVRVVIAGSAP
jgi:hypothetical protein